MPEAEMHNHTETNAANGSHLLERSIVDIFDEQARKTPDRAAAEYEGNTLTYRALQTASLRVSNALLSAGVVPLTTVPVLTCMSLDMLPAIIGVLRVGACYAPMDVAVWSASRVQAALSQVSSPIVVVTTACPGIRLPKITVGFQASWMLDPLPDSDRLHRDLQSIRADLRGDNLAWIIFTSGSTGMPKGVMIPHRATYAIAVLELAQDLEDAAERGIRCLLAFSVAFDGCAGVIWTTLGKGGTLAMASPSNFPLVAETCELLHLTPSMLAVLDPYGPYSKVRYIFLGAEAPNIDVVRNWITDTRKVFNTYGPSETTCIVSMGELSPNEEPPFGDLLPGL